jgi:hypothetical protein
MVTTTTQDPQILRVDSTEPQKIPALIPKHNLLTPKPVEFVGHGCFGGPADEFVLRATKSEPHS